MIRSMGLDAKKSGVNVLPWLWQVSGLYKIGIAALFILQVVFGICGVVSAMLFRALIDAAVDGGRSGFFMAGLLLAGLFFGEDILHAVSRFLYEWTRASLENRLKERLFSCLLHKDYAAVTAVHSGEWVTRLTSDTVVVAGGMVDILPSLGGMMARLLGALGALFFLQPAFFYILIPAGLLMILVTASLRKVLKRLHKKIQEANGEVLSFLQERLESLMIVRVFSMEKQTDEDAAQRMDKHKAARLKRNLFSNVCNLGFGFIVDAGYLLSAVYCGYGILNGTISYGTFTAVLQLVGQVQSPFAGITGVIPQYFAMTASAERLMEAEAYRDDGNENKLLASKIKQFYDEQFESLGVQNACFSYRSTDDKGQGAESFYVIDHLNLEIQKGEYVAFTGPSGCGKSTFLKLLMCLYPLDEGRRYIKAKKDEKAEEYALTSMWRGLFAYVPQGNQLMSGTIREIIAFGEPSAMAQNDNLMRALQIACADEFVSKLEHGIDTCLGERGAGLSEGQMQRIAIARAIFSDRPILILDEATSALDEATEQRLLENLQQMTDKTVLLITHRPAALRICNREIGMSGEVSPMQQQEGDGCSAGDMVLGSKGQPARRNVVKTSKE